jgi:uncharacterized membrane protein
MTTSTATSDHVSAFTLAPWLRAIILLAGGAMTLVVLAALARAGLGYSPELPHLRNVAITVHVASVLPAIPLGAWLLLARKGTRLHKLLGRVWIGLMVATATSAIFITYGGFSWLHIFVPITYRAVWVAVAAARAGNIRKHRNELIGLYLGALMLPGLAAFLIEGRLMHTMLLGG